MVDYIRALAADGRPLATITMLTGMPVEFVIEVLNEASHA